MKAKVDQFAAATDFVYILTVDIKAIISFQNPDLSKFMVIWENCQGSIVEKGWKSFAKNWDWKAKRDQINKEAMR